MFWTIFIILGIGWLIALPFIVNVMREIVIGGKVVGYHKLDWVHFVLGAFMGLFWPVWLLIKIFGKVMK